MSQPHALQITDLHKRYGKEPVLKGVSLTARESEVVAIIGPSGSGKSTLLRCINLLEQPSAGEIRIAGESLKLKSTRDGQLGAADARQLRKLRRNIGFVFQSFNLWPHKTVLANITEAPRRVLKHKREQAEQTALALLERVGLHSKAHCYPGQLSGGQQQRAAIARALAMDPKLMLFDEPTSALDPEMVQEVLSVIQDLTREQRTMVLVTHELAFARQIADTLIFMDQGQIAEQGPTAQLFDRPQSARLQQFLSHCS